MDALVLVMGGVATAVAVAQESREDLSQWIDVSDFEVRRLPMPTVRAKERISIAFSLGPISR